MKKDQLVIDGKVYLNSRRAAEIAGYSWDYVGQLCRSAKLECRMIGRSWYVEKESILKHQQETFKANHTSFTGNDLSGVPSASASSSVVSAAPSKFVGGSLADIPAPRPYAGAVRSALRYALFGGAGIAFAFVAFIAITRSMQGTQIALEPSAADSVTVDTNGASAMNAYEAGLVVVPSTGSKVSDTKLARSITNSFSDPVEVSMENGGTSGVITPVFKTVKGSEYMYVLVPVNTAASSSAPAASLDASK